MNKQSFRVDGENYSIVRIQSNYLPLEVFARADSVVYDNDQGLWVVKDRYGTERSPEEVIFNKKRMSIINKSLGWVF